MTTFNGTLETECPTVAKQASHTIIHSNRTVKDTKIVQSFY